ncbi:unnamed protein product [Heterobilharzia americana]|nr:unnamed protein product [Heterobilharzia americana]
MKEFSSVAIHFSWMLQFLATSLLYASIIIPSVLLHTYFKKRYQLHLSNGTTDSCSAKMVYICFVSDVDTSENVKKVPQIDLPIPVVMSPTRLASQSRLAELIKSIKSYLGFDRDASLRTSQQYYTLLGFCFLGLQSSYLLWGVLQERIMTKMYDNEKFEKSQYLVFCNRVTALLILIPLHFLNVGFIVNPWQKKQKAPFVEFAFASVSNVISSWCQYEALIYISFPSQVILKACKVLPVMFMGKFIQKRVYSGREYFTAAIICLGMILFFMLILKNIIFQTEKQMLDF